MNDIQGYNPAKIRIRKGRIRQMSDKLIIANCSGFYGDRISAARDMVEGGPVDVLTGDYLAELTMAILFRKTLKNPEEGYADTFLRQMEDVLEICLAKNIKVVSNAGGLNPKAMATAIKKLAEKKGLSPKIAWIEGDNLINEIASLKNAGEEFRHINTNRPLKGDDAITVTANAYLGGWGITKALSDGADIVVGGRIADASLVSGPSAWKFCWKENDWDKLAGAVVAGHVIECGTQATGGNYPFIEEIESWQNMGFPIAEIYPDGSSVITKHPGTGGIVNKGTVTSQLLYEIRGPGYLTPDVTARFDTIKLDDQGKNRVKISCVKGRPPTDTLKVCLNRLSGHRNMVRFIITGKNREKKASIIESMFLESLGGKDSFDEVSVRFHGFSADDPKTMDEAHSFFEIAVLGTDRELIERTFPKKAIEMALGSIPGFTLSDLPGKGAPVIRHWPALVSKNNVSTVVCTESSQYSVPWISDDTPPDKTDFTFEKQDEKSSSYEIKGLTLDKITGARSGDKGGDANLGVWVSKPHAYDFLKKFLTSEKLKELLPDTEEYEIERYELPNLNAINFYIKGYLGDGVASSLKSDPQAKTLGEYFRYKLSGIIIDTD